MQTPPLIEHNIEEIIGFHLSIANKICLEFSGFLKIHNVVNGSKYKITQIKFRKKGLEAFIKAVEDTNNTIGEKIRTIVGTNNVTATTAVTVLAAILQSRLDNYNKNRVKKLNYGTRLRSNNQLGLYLTLGVHDLETFFERGQKINKLSQAREEICATYHDYEAIKENMI